VIDTTARTFRVTIYRDDADLVGTDVSDLVGEQGLALQRSPLDIESPIACTAEFPLIANSNNSGDINLDPDTSTYIRPGARVLFEYQNYAGVWGEVPWGARQVIAFATADRPDSIDPGQPWKPWSVEIKCQQTLKQQQWIESAFNAEYGANAPGKFERPEQIGTYRDFVTLATSICRAKGLIFAPQPGDPTPTMVYNGYIGYDPLTADSALGFLQKILYCNPDTSGYTYTLWQDNQNRVRIGKVNLTTVRSQSERLFTARWELHSEDLISFKAINQQRQQMPGQLRVTAIARFDEFKTNPLTSNEKSPADGATKPTQIKEFSVYDYNNWVFAERFIKTKLTVPAAQIKKDAPGDVVLEKVETTKEYDLYENRRLSQATVRRFGPRHLLDEQGSFQEVELTKEVKTYNYNFDGTLRSIRTQFSAAPKLIQADAAPGQELNLVGANSKIELIQSGGDSAYSKGRANAFNLERQSDLIAYQPTSNANTPDSRPAQAETQEIPWVTRTLPIFQTRSLLYNNVPLSNRVKTIPIGAFVFDGSRMTQLADNLALREAGSYSQYEIKFPLRDAIAAAWEKPSMGLVVYDYATQKNKVFGSFGGETIVFGRDSVECLINAETIGTIEDGPMITAAEVGRITLDGQPRTTLDNLARIV
jgi:hypothetical protein